MTGIKLAVYDIWDEQNGVLITPNSKNTDKAVESIPANVYNETCGNNNGCIHTPEKEGR